MSCSCGNSILQVIFLTYCDELDFCITVDPKVLKEPQKLLQAMTDEINEWHASLDSSSN